LDHFEVLRIRDALVSANCVKKFQRYTLIIICIRLFLRIEEATGDEEDENTSRDMLLPKSQRKRVPTGLTDKSFIVEAFEYVENEVDSMVIKVKGKTDKQPVYLRLNRQKNNVELCPVTHLLTYIYLIGYKGGHLFPTDSELSNRPIDGIYKTYRVYDDVLLELKTTFSDILDVDSKEYGTHTLRKTAYVFALWSMNAFTDTNFLLVMASARHKDPTTAQLYAKGARLALEQAKKAGKDVTLAGEWMEVAIPDLVRYKRNNNLLGKEGASLWGLAKHFVEEQCGWKNSEKVLKW
jgi:hypothetical protein